MSSNKYRTLTADSSPHDISGFEDDSRPFIDISNNSADSSDYFLHPSTRQSLRDNSGSRASYTHSSMTRDSTASSLNQKLEDPFRSGDYDLDIDMNPFGGFPASAFPLTIEEEEDDDYLHNPDPIRDAYLEKHRFWYDVKHMDRRSGFGIAGIILLALGLLLLFILLPVLTYSNVLDNSTSSSTVSNDTEALSDYVYPTLSGVRTSLVDEDTPDSAHTITSKDGDTWELVFSDEFNAEGRTFYDGDDQFWTAPDINYYVTKDLEWYDPDAVLTSNGTVSLRMDAYENHDLFYRSGMLQSWNKFCFTQGYIEISARLPNYGNVSGLWPGLWTIGNLARPGYGATSEGVWPYSYNSCDSGITANQSSNDGISYLVGQKLNTCTCDDEDHPNQGTGRGAPEIDVIEGAVDTTLRVGTASQSMQVAPFDIWYMTDYDFIEIYNFSTTAMNSYAGGPFQQAISAVSTLNTTWYQDTGGKYQTYGVEFLNDLDDGYCTWRIGENKTFTMYSTALHPNGNIDWRHISREPMSIVMNLGVSNNWAYIDWESILFPAIMEIDYVRVYQPSDQIDVTCDPEAYPTYDYIESHKKAYYNQNYTTWEEAGYTFPKNILTGNCTSSQYSSDDDD